MKRQISVRAFVRDDKIYARLKQDINDDFIDFHGSVSEQPLQVLGKQALGADILMVELDAEAGDEITRFINVLEQLDSLITVIVLLNDSSPVVVRQLMKEKVSDVFPLPGDMDELVNEVKTMAVDKQNKLESKNCQVISFIDAKGGCGATTLAVNTAFLLADKHKARVCLIDFDLQFGDVALQLDISQKESVMDAIYQPERIDSIFIKALLFHHDSGLSVLSSPATLEDTSKIDPATISAIIDAVSEHHDFVILDLPHQITPWTIEALRKSDRHFLVAQRCLSILRDAKLILSGLKKHGVDTTYFEVINNRDSRKTGIVSKNQMLGLLERKSMFSVRNDYPLAIEAQETGRPIEKLAIASGLSKDIKAIADAIFSGKRSSQKHKVMDKLFHQ